MNREKERKGEREEDVGEVEPLEMRCHASRACVLYRARTCEVGTKEYSRGKNPLFWSKYSSQEPEDDGNDGRGLESGWLDVSRILFLPVLRFTLFLVPPLRFRLSFVSVCCPPRILSRLAATRNRRNCNAR